MIFAGLVLSAVGLQAQVRLTPNQVLTRSTTVAPGVYRMPAGEDLQKPAVEVRGDNITVDFAFATLEGTPQTTEPDKRKGLAVLVHGKNVTIKNLRARGYKVGLLARNSPGLKVMECDFSYNWKQHLASTQEKEDTSDWMSFHDNEKDEWLRYGAAIYLNGCDNFEVRGTRAEGGQCGLMLTRCNKGLVWNSNFSFLSAIGLGMYRSSDNRIMHNNIDWCVRGFSYGKYNRGQDSAGILIYEQSNRNIFAYNSVTHGGDGFFLWAGKHTMDTGEGGCNDNLLYGNDFSHAPTNGIEATFSRNNFVNNLILECWHGIWGGYSYDSKVIANVFGRNAEGIAWEHGQNNIVQFNDFTADNESIYIWSNPTQDPNWGYAKKRDTRSRDWTITNNEFKDEFTNVLHVRRSENVRFVDNLLERNGTPIKNDGQVTGLVDSPNRTTAGTPAPPTSSLNQGEVDGYLGRFRFPWAPMNLGNFPRRNPEVQRFEERMKEAAKYAPKPLLRGRNPFLKPGTYRGWRYIFVDEWGPYDFKRPLLWPREQLRASSSVAIDNGKEVKAGSKTQKFEIQGPKGTWKVVSVKNATLSTSSGYVPGVVEVTTPMYGAGNVDIQLEYTGGATVDYRGVVTAAGKPVAFGYSQFFAPIDWTIHFFKWSKAANPSDVHSAPEEATLQAAFKGQPLKELRQDRLDFAGYAFDKVTGGDHYATVAEGSFTVPAGDYVLELTTDDGARLWLDGKPLVTDAWKYQGPTLYSRDVRLDGSTHKIRVEHFQIDGYAALKVNLRPKK